MFAISMISSEWS